MTLTKQSEIHFISTKELSTQLGVNRAKLQLLRETGLLRAVKVGKGYRYYSKDIERFVEIAQNYDLSSVEKIVSAGHAERIRKEHEKKKTFKTRNQKDC